MHLARESDAGDFIPARTHVVEGAPDCLAAGSPPIPRILLRPSQLRGGKRCVVVSSGSNHLSSLVHDQSASPAGADVDPEELDISSCMLPGGMSSAEPGEVTQRVPERRSADLPPFRYAIRMIACVEKS
jgi:hypothetical protein